MRLRTLLFGHVLTILASACGEGGDPYANLRDSPLLSTLPPDVPSLDVRCRKVEQWGATDYFACSRIYATDLDFDEVRAFHLPLIRDLGYEVSIDGPQYQTSNRYLISAQKGEDLSLVVRVQDPIISPEFAEWRWTVVVEVAERD